MMMKWDNLLTERINPAIFSAKTTITVDRRDQFSELDWNMNV